jgi:hypothetical protein
MDETWLSPDKPVFNELPEREFTGVEGESLLVAPQATGRPATISYTWTKDRAPLAPGPHLHVEGPLLNFTRLNRSDSGVYTCEAVNSEGATSISITVSVQCKLTQHPHRPYPLDKMLLGQNGSI